MEVKNQTLFFYPFSGYNKQDLYSVIELFSALHENEKELTVVMADTFENENMHAKLFQFIYEIGLDQCKLSDVQSELIEFQISLERQITYERINPDYGWSTNSKFGMYRFDLMLKNDSNIAIELIFTNMDAFNCFDFLKEQFENYSIEGEINLVLKYPGFSLNEEGFKAFSELGLNFKGLNKVFVCEENPMPQPDGFEFTDKIQLFNCYQNKLFDAVNIHRIKNVKIALRFS